MDLPAALEAEVAMAEMLQGQQATAVQLAVVARERPAVQLVISRSLLLSRLIYPLQQLLLWY
jgi:hypothetical protein